MTREGVTVLGRTPAARLRALVGRAGDPCCCVGGGAYKAIECCDGEPAIWIAREEAEACGVPDGVVIINEGAEPGQISGRCFRLTSDFASDADIERLGLSVYRGRNVRCVTGCGDEACPPCPDGCCIYATLPSCFRNPSPSSLRCCVLGSAYSLEYLDEYEETVTGPAGGQTFSVIGGDCPRVCVWPSETTTETRYRSNFAFMVHSRQDPLTGEWCSGVRPSATRLRTRHDRVYLYDGISVEGCEAIVRNGRYVDENESSSDDIAEFQIGEMPAFMDPDWRDEQGQPILERLCAGHAEVELCVIPFPEPCPNPDNPNQAVAARIVYDARGSVDCNGGEQVLIRQEWRWPCRPETFPGEPVIYKRQEWRRRWTVRVLSREGCEILTCPERRPAPSPQPLRMPTPNIDGKRARVTGCGGCGAARKSASPAAS